jgi:DNA mismatch endonuclease (patch repair protein)
VSSSKQERKPARLEDLRDTYEVSLCAARTMQANRSNDTSIETMLRRALWKAGLRGYRKNVNKLPGKPDIVYGSEKLAIFVHGCFWHRCPKCNPPKPKTNSRYWQAKFVGNVLRDSTNKQRLQSMGYRVLVFWECCLNKSLDKVVARVIRTHNAGNGAVKR